MKFQVLDAQVSCIRLKVSTRRQARAPVLLLPALSSAAGNIWNILSAQWTWAEWMYKLISPQEEMLFQ